MGERDEFFLQCDGIKRWAPRDENIFSSSSDPVASCSHSLLQTLSDGLVIDISAAQCMELE